MIDKKIVILIGVLIVVAVIILALGFANIKLGGTPSDSFSALFDKMQKDDPNSTEVNLVLTSEFIAGQQIDVKDEIVSMSYNGFVTTFTFVYTGTAWENKTHGTDFEVKMNFGHIGVQNAMFSVSLTGDFRPSYSPGDMISLRTTAVKSGDNLVLGQNWILVAA